MPEFKAGDRVRCIESGGARMNPVRRGRIYTVLRTDPLRQMVCLKELSHTHFFSERFELYRISNEERIRKRMEEVNE